MGGEWEQQLQLTEHNAAGSSKVSGHLLGRGVLTALRDVVPIRPLSRAEAMRVAELQAALLLQWGDVQGPPVPDALVAAVPRVQIDRVEQLPVAGAVQWVKGRWTIVIRGADDPRRQRFSIAHEFKHLLDHPFISVLYPCPDGSASHKRAEEMCNYFAASLLMPRTWMRRHWHKGPQDIAVLARRFKVSTAAMRIRLAQVGLTDVHRSSGP